MKNVLLTVFCIVALVACNNTRTLVDDINEASPLEIQTTMDTMAFNQQGRNLVYLLDPTCSVCIGNYIMFINSIESPVCKYDSLFTVVLDSSYLVNIEYYLERDGITRPTTERYIIDNDGSITDHFYNMANNNAILVFDNSKLVYGTTAFAYRYEEGVGLVRDNK